MSDAFERGMAKRRAILGDEHVDRAQDQTTDFDADFQDLITRVAWGDVWSRPGLSTRDRHLVTLAVLCALGREHELEMHVRATSNTGVTSSDLKEVLLQVGLYAGVPCANRGYAIAKRVLGEPEAGP